MSDLLQTLRRANQLRNKEWDPDEVLDEAFFAVELAGETGEACNVVKKIIRQSLGLPGSRSDVNMLAEELADVVIVVDLLANCFNIDLSKAIVEKFNKTSDKIGLSVKLPS